MLKRTHNFPDKVTIVLKTKTNQGFIALDKKSIESGISWAGYYYGKGEKPYEIIEYDNGKFTLKLSKAASDSNQGSKLSFWTLEVTAPDGRVFEVGINSESLIETMIQTTVANGDIEGEYYLGRTNGQQSIARKGSTYYNEYLEVIETKKQPLTKNYKVGNIIINKREEYMFIGEFPSHIKATVPDSGSYFSREVLISLSKNKKPTMRYFYLRKGYRKETFEDGYIVSYDNKIGGRISDDTVIREKNPHMLKYFQYLKEKLLTWENRNFYYTQDYLRDYFAVRGITEIEDAVKEMTKLNIQHMLKK
jgi:hypothetical protein